jgi:hypothetical protein
VILARKLKYLRSATSVVAAFVPDLFQATPVDPAIFA